MSRRVTQRPSITIALFVGMTLLLTACAETMVSDDAKKTLAKDVDCSTAKQDIATLKKERAGTMKRVRVGLEYALPIAAAINIFRSYNQDGTLEEFYKEREQVLTGEYNKSLDAKKEEIEGICGV